MNENGKHIIISQRQHSISLNSLNENEKSFDSMHLIFSVVFSPLPSEFTLFLFSGWIFVVVMVCIICCVFLQVCGVFDLMLAILLIHSGKKKTIMLMSSECNCNNSGMMEAK